MDVSLRNATEYDVRFLHQLRDQTMRSYLEQAGMPITHEAYEDRISFEFQAAKIIEVSGQRVGLFKAAFDESKNHWQLIQVQIANKFQGLGIGSKLIKGLIAQATSSGASIGLSVIDSNPALALYEQLGFKIVSRSGSEYSMEIRT